jgi:ssDNA-binding replication factor A large subunit
MAAQEIIQQILLKRPDVGREQVLERLRTEQERSGGLIADATLLRLIASEFGVEIPQDKFYEEKFSISHLCAGLNDVSVSGRIIAVYQSRTFEGKRPGKFASVIVSDRQAVIRVMLWNEKAEAVDSGELKMGQIVRFWHGYTKDDRDGKAELHLGDKSRIEIEPQDVRAEDYPIVGNFGTKIKDITSSQKNVHVTGFVKKVFPSSSFVRQDQPVGMVKRIILADDTSEISVVFWNEKAKELEPILRETAKLDLVNARVKATSNGDIEIHADTSTYASVDSISEQTSKSSELERRDENR